MRGVRFCNSLSTFDASRAGRLSRLRSRSYRGALHKKVCKFLSDLITFGCCVLLTIGGWKVVALNMPNIAPVSEIPLGVVFIACLVCSVGMGILLLNSMYRLLTGQMAEQEMCPDFDDAL